MHFSLTDVLGVYFICCALFFCTRKGLVRYYYQMWRYIYIYYCEYKDKWESFYLQNYSPLSYLFMSYYIHLLALLPVLYMMAFLSNHISTSFCCQVLWNLCDASWISRAGTVSAGQNQWYNNNNNNDDNNNNNSYYYHYYYYFIILLLSLLLICFIFTNR